MFGLMQPLQLFRGALDDLLKVGAAVADRMAPKGLQNGFRHGRGAGDHQGEFVLHGAWRGGRRRGAIDQHKKP